MKMFGLADCNNFYVSCERIFNLSVRNVPVVVLSNNDGCVISRSQEAKDLGVKMGVPAHEIKHLIKNHNIQLFSSNYTLYADISSRVMTSLSDLCPQVEVYSIDEAFLDLSIIPNHELQQFGENLKYKIGKWTKIPICVGIAPTKTLAKLANKIAKKSGPGVFVLDSEEKIKKTLSEYPVEDVWGIGRQHSKQLKSLGITTAQQLAEQNDNLVQKLFSITGLRLVRELRGESCIGMTQPRNMSKGICCSRSFGKSISTLQNLEEAVANFANRCGEKLRRQNSCANVLTVFINTNYFNKSVPQYSKSITVNFPVPTNNAHEIQKFAARALKSIFKSEYDYKKAGVIVTGIIPDTQQQTGLFDTEDREKLEKLSNLMDKVNAKFGRNTLNLAIQGTSKIWQPNAKMLSPRYTTNWDDIPKIST